MESFRIGNGDFSFSVSDDVEIISFENIKKILTYDDNFIIHCQNNKIYMIKLRENDKFDKIEITTINENYEIIKLGDGFLILNNNCFLD